jgi:hypothetical protein
VGVGACACVPLCIRSYGDWWNWYVPPRVAQSEPWARRRQSSARAHRAMATAASTRGAVTTTATTTTTTTSANTGDGATRKRRHGERDATTTSGAGGATTTSGAGGAHGTAVTAATTTTTSYGGDAHASDADDVSERERSGCSTLYKRKCAGDRFARRLIDFRGFELSDRQANEIARFIDLLPPEMEPLVRETLDNCADIDDAIAKLASVKMVEQTTACSVGDFSEPAISEAHSAGGDVGDLTSKARSEREAAAEGNRMATSAAPVLTAEWVNGVVNEMAASKDMSDAQNRASRVLQAFEGAVRHRCAEISDYSKVMKMKRENALLKRAVAIQNSRMQELAPLQARVRELEGLCAHYSEQLQAEQRQNYSLSVNLRLAMDQSPLPSRNHDVF